MCKTQQPDTLNQTRRLKHQRVKLWELSGEFHCPIIGTCLSIQELHKVARQSRINFPVNISDYDIHGHMVSEASTKGIISRNLHKLLDRKYHRWIQQLLACPADKFTEAWQQAVSDGDIAGMFWALLSHPHTDAALTNKIYQQVHMLSHLQGHSQRSTLRRCANLENQLSALQQQTKRQKQQFQEQEQHHQQQELLYQAQQKALEAIQQQSYQSPPNIQQLTEKHQHSEKQNRQLLKRLDWAETQLAHREIRMTELLQGFEGLKEQLLESKQEKEDLELCLKKFLQQDPIEQTSTSWDLDGKHLIYVGGRPGTLPHLRALTETYNGNLIHHDGGIEDNQSELQKRLNRADLVFCAIDCVSHNACLKVKRYCKKHEKPFIPLRSSSLSSFTSGLQAAMNV